MLTYLHSMRDKSELNFYIFCFNLIIRFSTHLQDFLEENETEHRIIWTIVRSSYNM